MTVHKLDLRFVGVRLPAPTVKRADAIARATQSNRSQVIRHALSIGLAALAPTYTEQTEAKADAA